MADYVQKAAFKDLILDFLTDGMRLQNELIWLFHYDMVLPNNFIKVWYSLYGEIALS